jgi:uncharacterized membrane protein YfcA
MALFVICLAAFVASGLTLISGFGLGTILMPVFALFFPVPVAVAATAVVHLLNNLFKIFLVGRLANRAAVLRFGVPAMLAALAGAALLTYVAALPALLEYRWGGTVHSVTAVKLVVGVLIAGFAVFELLPVAPGASLGRAFLPLGGVLSGFFGGLSGNQGPFRSLFLIRAGLSRDEFVGTSVVVAVLVDLCRLVVYGIGFQAARTVGGAGTGGYVLAATLAAFAGALAGKRVLARVTYRGVRVLVAVMLIAVGIGLAAGLV